VINDRTRDMDDVIVDIRTDLLMLTLRRLGPARQAICGDHPFQVAAFARERLIVDPVC
jgi:hypothetical protein